MNDTIAKREYENDAGEPAPDIAQRARVIARALLRVQSDAAYGVARARPAELAIAEGILDEVPELPAAHDVALEHYRAQAALSALALAANARLLFRAAGEPAEYIWERPGTTLRVSHAFTVAGLTSFIEGNEGDARMLLDVACGRKLRCGGWTVSEVTDRD